MGCVFSLPEDRRDAAERSVKVFDLLCPLRHNKRFFYMVINIFHSYRLILLFDFLAQLTLRCVSVSLTPCKSDL